MKVLKPKATLEIKYRGPLSKYQNAQLFKFLNTKGECITVADEHTLYFESTAFPSLGDFKWGVARMSVKINH